MRVKYSTHVKWCAFKESYLLILIRHYFLEKFWVYRKNEQKARRFPYMPYPHPQTSSPTINIPHQSGTFVTIDESTLMHYYHQTLEFTLGFTLGVVCSMGFDIQ